jgi:hypothetical protein
VVSGRGLAPIARLRLLPAIYRSTSPRRTRSPGADARHAVAREHAMTRARRVLAVYRRVPTASARPLHRADRCHQPADHRDGHRRYRGPRRSDHREETLYVTWALIDGVRGFSRTRTVDVDLSKAGAGAG